MSKLQQMFASAMKVERRIARRVLRFRLMLIMALCLAVGLAIGDGSDTNLGPVTMMFVFGHIVGMIPLQAHSPWKGREIMWLEGLVIAFLLLWVFLFDTRPGGWLQRTDILGLLFLLGVFSAWLAWRPYPAPDRNPPDREAKSAAVRADAA